MLLFQTIFIIFSASTKVPLSPLEMRIEELRHHIGVESIVLDGCRNAVKLLQMTQDKKALLEVIAINLSLILFQNLFIKY